MRVQDDSLRQQTSELCLIDLGDSAGPTRREPAFQPALPVIDPTCHSGLQHEPTGNGGQGAVCHAYQPSNQEPPQPQFNHLGFMRYALGACLKQARDGCCEPDKSLHPSCRIRLERVTTTKKGNYGFLVFVRHGARKSWLYDGGEGMVINITGDTLYCLCKLLRNEPTTRPMPLHLLSNFISQGNASGREGCDLIRVAVTGLKQDTYVAKAYFGADSIHEAPVCPTFNRGRIGYLISTRPTSHDQVCICAIKHRYFLMLSPLMQGTR